MKVDIFFLFVLYLLTSFTHHRVIPNCMTSLRGREKKSVFYLPLPLGRLDSSLISERVVAVI